MKQAAYTDADFIQIETSKIRENPLNKRIYNKTDDSAFLQSIREQGILEPLVLAPDYTLISGSRRLEAVRKLKLAAVPVLIRRFGNENIALVEYNRYRVKTPLEIFREAETLKAEFRREGFNGDIRTLTAQKVGVSEGYLQMVGVVAGSRRRDLISRVESGVMGVSQAYRILTQNGKAGEGLVSLGRYYSGKQALTPKLVSMISTGADRHRCYVEVFGGFCSVLLNKPPSEVEVYNDTSKDVANFVLCLRNEPLTVVSETQNLPYSRWLFTRLIDEIVGTECDPPDPQRAAKWWTLNWMSYGGLHGSGNKLRVSQGNWSHSADRNFAIKINETASRLFCAAARLTAVQIEAVDFRKVLELYDGPDTLFYCDPPY